MLLLLLLLLLRLLSRNALMGLQGAVRGVKTSAAITISA
jgi:hypothetical protein